MLALPLFVALAAPPAATCPDEAAAALTLGPDDAATKLDAFIDPASPQALVTWIELLRIVGEREPELRIDVWLVRPLGPIEPRAERVRRL
ncbi:MAG TPA: hypothetical protein VG755_12665, partial [Nannocystaceae bacterium]|nr:hypothetical protein [Nannocystaceae bacterium]